MNKKGFTLVELIAVIIILSIIILIAFSSYTRIQKQVLESQYENVVLRLTEAASDYARDTQATNLIYISVQELIDLGIISPDDDNYIYDPRDNSIMNCFAIRVMLNDGDYESTLDKKYELANGKCDDTFIKNNSIDIFCDGARCKSDWYNKDITLSITGIDANTLKSSVVEWTNLLGDYVKQEANANKTINTTVSNVLSTTYNVVIRTDKGNYNITKVIKIDKESPTLISKKMLGDYDTKQNLEIEASDISGSGILGYALTDKANCNGVSYQNNNKFDVTKSGTYKVCLVDKVGNKSEEEIKINKVNFNYNNLSSTTPKNDDLFLLDGDSNEELLNPSRPGYTFKYWVDESGNRVHDLNSVDDGDSLNAEWNFNDIEVPSDKIDKEFTTIENKVNLIMCLDTSGSMSWGGKTEQLVNAVKDMIRAVNFDNGSTVSVIQFTTVIKSEIVVSHNMQEALNYVDTYYPGGDEKFDLALNHSYDIIRSHNLEKDKTFIIIFTDGNDVASTQESRRAAGAISQNYAKAVYGIGLDLDESWKWKLLDVLKGPEFYFDASVAQNNLGDIFQEIQEQIREEIKLKSANGLINLLGLYVDSECPFTITVKGNTYTFTTLASINHLLTNGNNLDLTKVDSTYKLNGDLSSFSFSYYHT